MLQRASVLSALGEVCLEPEKSPLEYLLSTAKAKCFISQFQCAEHLKRYHDLLEVRGDRFQIKLKYLRITLYLSGNEKTAENGRWLPWLK